VATSFVKNSDTQIVVDNTHMTASFTPTGFDTAKQTLFVAWPSSNYVQLNNAICWCYDGAQGGPGPCNLP
jgi:hypothetical protein